MQYGKSSNDCLECSRGPVNEDVFAAPATAEGKAVDSDIQDITEQIHRLLLQVSFLILLEKESKLMHHRDKSNMSEELLQGKESRNYNTMQGVYLYIRYLFIHVLESVSHFIHFFIVGCGKAIANPS